MPRPRLLLMLVLATMLIGPAARAAAQDASPGPASEAWPTASQRLGAYALDIGGPLALINIAGSAAAGQALAQPREWMGASGFGKRVASAAGQTIVFESMEYGLAELLREDPAFQLSRRHGILPRFADAASRSVTARRRDGHRVFSLSRLGGHVAGGMALLLWYPDRYQPRDGLTFAASSVASSAVANLIREFVLRR